MRMTFSSVSVGVVLMKEAGRRTAPPDCAAYFLPLRAALPAFTPASVLSFC